MRAIRRTYVLKTCDMLSLCLFFTKKLVAHAYTHYACNSGLAREGPPGPWNPFKFQNCLRKNAFKIIKKFYEGGGFAPAPPFYVPNSIEITKNASNSLVSIRFSAEHSATEHC